MHYPAIATSIYIAPSITITYSLFSPASPPLQPPSQSGVFLKLPHYSWRNSTTRMQMGRSRRKKKKREEEEAAVTVRNEHRRFAQRRLKQRPKTKAAISCFSGALTGIPPNTQNHHTIPPPPSTLCGVFQKVLHTVRMYMPA